MFKIEVKHPKDGYHFTWTTEDRPQARAVTGLARDNGCDVRTSVSVPASDRPVKFKGVD